MTPSLDTIKASLWMDLNRGTSETLINTLAQTIAERDYWKTKFEESEAKQKASATPATP
jgi:hypothetical protein